MGVRRIAFAPLYLLANWVDDNPISALGAVITLGALAVLLASISLGTATDVGGLAFDSATAQLLAETALERPAYLAAVILGLAAVIFYNG